MEAYLRRLYTDPALPSSLGGVNALYRQVKRDKTYALTRKDVAAWLRGNRAYTLHKPVRKKYARRMTLTRSPDSQWQSDLIDLSIFAAENNGMRYLLTTVDVFFKLRVCSPRQEQVWTGSSAGVRIHS